MIGSAADQPSFIFYTAIPQPHDNGDKKNIGLIVGLSVGIPVGVIIIGVIIFIAYKKKAKYEKVMQDIDASDSKEEVPMQKADLEEEK